MIAMAEQDVQKVFQDIKLEEYVPAIVEKGFFDLEYLISLEGEDLTLFYEAVEISKVGH